MITDVLLDGEWTETTRRELALVIEESRLLTEMFPTDDGTIPDDDID